MCDEHSCNTDSDYECRWSRRREETKSPVPVPYGDEEVTILAQSVYIVGGQLELQHFGPLGVEVVHYHLRLHGPGQQGGGVRTHEHVRVRSS